MRTPLPLFCAAFLFACDGEVPLDPNAAPRGGGISGTVVLVGGGAPAATFVTVDRADDPGPPAGPGSPVTFASVPASAFSAAGVSMPSAPFALTGLPPGDYLLAALVDRDSDFSPFGAGLAGATCGDGVGAHVTDLVSLTPAAVTVHDGRQQSEVTVVVGEPLSTERPAFVVDGPLTVSASRGADPSAVQVFRLGAAGVGATYARDLVLKLEGPCVADQATCEAGPTCLCQPAACQTALPLWLVDADADRAVDPYPAPAQAAAGALDVWPRVYLRFLGQPTTDPRTGEQLFTHDLGSYVVDGEERPEQWVAEAFPMAAELAGAALQGLDPTTAYGVPVGAPALVQSLSVTFSPVFRHYHRGGAMGVDATGPFDLVDLRVDGAAAAPLGYWSVTVIGPTGQTWSVPNEIGLQGLPPAGLLDGTGQADALVLVD